MVLIAKTNLSVGSICFAAEGSVVSENAVKQYGWEDQVTVLDVEPKAVPTAKVTVAEVPKKE